MNKQVYRPTMALSSYFDKKRRNRLIALGVLAACILAVLILWGMFAMTKEAPLPMVQETASTKGRITPPSFLFVITGGPDDLALRKPLDVAVAPDGNVYVTTSAQKYGSGRVEVFDADGNYKFSFNRVGGNGTLRAPVGIAINSKGTVYVTDIRLKGVFIYDSAGKFLGKFKPDNKADYVWGPLGIAFDGADNLYVTDVYSEHQVLVFKPDGDLKLKFGSTATTNKKGEYPGKFFFPNDVFVDKDGSIFVADSNNRRVQVFSPAGKYLYTVETAGLPRGIAVDARNRLYVVDALGHDVSIFKKDDKSISPQALAIFGEQGVEFGQLLYPNGLTLDNAERRIYVTNRENNRVEVWGWPVAASNASVAKKTISLLPLLIPPLLLLGWLITRRRRIFADEPFMQQIINHNHLEHLAKTHKKVFVDPDVYEAYKDYREGDIVVGDYLVPIKVDPALAANTSKIHNIDDELGTIFAAASKGWTRPRILAEKDDAHRVATKLNIESMDHRLFNEFHGLELNTKIKK